MIVFIVLGEKVRIRKIFKCIVGFRLATLVLRSYFFFLS